jgi:hypothetical protein
LSDQDLLARLETLAGKEREATAELVAHLAALDSRQMLYAAQGYGSLFSYCTQALRLSEDAACNRIEAARACRRFPLILDLLASGSLSLTSVRLLAPHLTAENHESVLARARDRKRREIEALVAELAPRPDLPSTVRKVPCRTATRQSSPVFAVGPGTGPGLEPGSALRPAPDPAHGPGAAPALGPAMNSQPSAADFAIASAASALPVTPRPIVQASAPTRYRVQFTIGQETHDKLRRVQALLRREISDGDPGAIFDRALTVLLEKVEKSKLAVAAKPRPSRPIRPAADPRTSIRPAADSRTLIRHSADPQTLIRPAADREVPSQGLLSRQVPPALPSGHMAPALPSGHVPPALPSRTVPREVKREVWQRDAGQCAFVSSTGRRCTESTFLEYHHIQPYAKQGPATVANISLRCRRHNQYEAELIFGSRAPSIVQGCL